MDIKTDIILRKGDLEATGGYRDSDENRPEFMLTRDIVFEVDHPGSGLAVIVPAGYVTDRFSLPGLIQSFQPDHEKWLMPALVHDWLYDVGRVKRYRADSIFSQAMKASGVKWWHRAGAFTGVRLGGGKGYGKPEKNNQILVRRAREQGVHTWGEDREARYAGLPKRLNTLREMYGYEAPPVSTFDAHTFFHGENGVRGSLFPAGLKESQVTGCEGIIEAFRTHAPHGTREQLAYILATAYHETGFTMEPVREAFGESDADTKRKLQASFDAGKLEWVKSDYWSDGFYGRGLVQLTHKRNYDGPLRQAVRDRFNVDILQHPDLLIERFDVSAFVLIEGMMRNMTLKGDFTADALEDHVNEKKVDFINARRVVNPSDLPTFKTIAAQAEAFDLALKDAGWTPPATPKGA
jgi:hypothetical protein